jgi:hypothetical protein
MGFNTPLPPGAEIVQPLSAGPVISTGAGVIEVKASARAVTVIVDGRVWFQASKFKRLKKK